MPKIINNQSFGAFHWRLPQNVTETEVSTSSTNKLTFMGFRLALDPSLCTQLSPCSRWHEKFREHRVHHLFRADILQVPSQWTRLFWSLINIANLTSTSNASGNASPTRVSKWKSDMNYNEVVFTLKDWVGFAASLMRYMTYTPLWRAMGVLTNENKNTVVNPQ